MVKKKRTKKFPKEDVPLLVLLAKGEDPSPEEDRYTILAVRSTEVVDRYGWLKSLTKEEAQEELEIRFRSIIATLVNVCITGRPNFFSSFQITFLRMFVKKGTPVQNIALRLKKDLSSYDKEELFGIGQLASLLAIDRCETNYVSTIIVCFKELIQSLTTLKEVPKEELDTFASYSVDIDDEMAYNNLIQSLTEEEQIAFDKFLVGRISRLPKSIEVKARKYYVRDF